MYLLSPSRTFDLCFKRMSASTLLEPQGNPVETPYSNGVCHDSTALDNVCTASTRHPLGVKPSGNALTLTAFHNAYHSMGLFRRLSDTLLLVVLEHLDHHGLVKLGSTCRALYAYSTYDQLWRDLAVDKVGPKFEWRRSSRAT